MKAFRSTFTEVSPDAHPVPRAGGDLEPDPDLRDFENVPLEDDVEAFVEREVRPHVPDAWMDRTKDKVGYEISFNRHFYRFTPPRPLEAIDDIAAKLSDRRGFRQVDVECAAHGGLLSSDLGAGAFASAAHYNIGRKVGSHVEILDRFELGRRFTAARGEDRERSDRNHNEVPRS